MNIFPKSKIKSFWSNVEVGAPDECWLYKNKPNNSGYGTIHIGSRTDNTRKVIGVHRFSYMVANNCKIPDGLQINHKCYTRLCVNPNHLEVVTVSENLKKCRPYVRHFSKKTHCPKGHEYTKENTRLYKNRRHCKTCNRIACLKSYHKNKLDNK
jgi:hypothetical protein